MSLEVSAGGLPALLQIHIMEAGEPPASQKEACTEVYTGCGAGLAVRWALLISDIDKQAAACCPGLSAL